MAADYKTRFFVGVFELLRRVVRVIPSRLLLALSATFGELIGRVCRREILICSTQLKFAFSPDFNWGGSKERGGSSDYQGEGEKLQQKYIEVRANDEPAHYKRLSVNVFRHIGECVGEVMIWDRFFERTDRLLNGNLKSNLSESCLPSYKYLSVSGENLIYDLVKSGKGAVGLSGHLGSFELMAIYLARCGLRMSIIGRVPNNRIFAQVLEKMRRSYGVEMLWREDGSIARKIIKAIQQQRTLAVLIDQDSNVKNHFSPFFGLEAASPVAPIELAVNYRLPVFTCFIHRKSRMYHHIQTEDVQYSPDDPKAAQMILDVYNQRLQKLVCSYPEQWIWWHRRWRRRPGVNYRVNPELLRNTGDYLNWLGEFGGSERSEGEEQIEHLG